MESSRNPRGAAGFTLIELLVVMAIISTLAGLALYGIPAIMRERDKTACKARLQAMYKYMLIYQNSYNGLSMRSGPEFVLSIWDANIVDHTLKDAEIFFCPSLTGTPDSLEDVNPFDIDYTGPDQDRNRGGRRRRHRMKIQDKDANEKVIVCDKVPFFADDEDREHMPHADKGICYLTLGGATEWIEASAFGEYVVIGPESPVERFERMVPEGDQ